MRYCLKVSTYGENWKTIHTVSGLQSYSTHYVTLPEPQIVRYILYAVPEGTPTNSYNKENSYCCNIAEIELYGKAVPIETEVKNDMNGDGEFSIADLVLLQNWLLAPEHLLLTVKLPI